MESEIEAFIKIWLTATASLIFCHQIAARIPAGAARLLSLLPIFYLFAALPLRLSSVHLGGPTVFYLLWLGTFKLLLFSFDRPPLAAEPPLSLPHFIAAALLPIKITKTPSTHKPPKFLLLKFFLLVLVVSSYKFREHFHQYFILAVYCCNVYLGVELMLALTAAPLRAAAGLEMEAQFDEPYLATSLQDFWGRRWNLMVTGILRPTVYLPVRRLLGGGERAAAAAIVATFAVSGLMHEVIYYYLTRARPTWEVTWFFVLHGFLVAAEVGVKKWVGGRWRVPAAVARPLTVGVVAVSGGWLFFPQIVRNGVDLKAIDEYYIFVRFVNDCIRSVLGWIFPFIRSMYD